MTCFDRAYDDKGAHRLEAATTGQKGGKDLLKGSTSFEGQQAASSV
jgi:hypothetical protein